MLAVNKKLCGTKFELKVNDIRFVGHPVNLEDYKSNYPTENDAELSSSGSSILIFNIVFALKVRAYLNFKFLNMMEKHFNIT